MIDTIRFVRAPGEQTCSERFAPGDVAGHRHESAIAVVHDSQRAARSELPADGFQGLLGHAADRQLSSEFANHPVTGKSQKITLVVVIDIQRNPVGHAAKNHQRNDRDPYEGGQQLR